MEQVFNLVAGAVGGLLFGVAGYVATTKDKEDFEWFTFVKGVTPAIIAGILVGATQVDWFTAFLAGISGGTLSNYASKLIDQKEIITL